MSDGIRRFASYMSEISRGGRSGEDVPVAIRQGIEEGWIRPRAHAGPLKTSAVRLRFADGLTSEQVISEDRDDR